MPSEKKKIDIDSIAKDIAGELLDKMQTQDSFMQSSTVLRTNDCAPSWGQYSCEVKDCDDNFDCYPAKKFKCDKFDG